MLVSSAVTFPRNNTMNGTPDYKSFISISRSSRETLIDLACVTALMGYFLHFAVPSLRGGFSQDEMMNMFFYWHPGILRCLWANICFWTDFYRPAGALYYLPIYHIFSLNPEPYRILQVGIVAGRQSRSSIGLVGCLRCPARSRFLRPLSCLTMLTWPTSCFGAPSSTTFFADSSIFRRWPTTFRSVSKEAICGQFTDGGVSAAVVYLCAECQRDGSDVASYRSSI